MSGESNPTATMPAPIQFGSADTQDLSFNPNGLRSPSKSIPDNAGVIVLDDDEMEDAQGDLQDRVFAGVNPSSVD